MKTHPQRVLLSPPVVAMLAVLVVAASWLLVSRGAAVPAQREKSNSGPRVGSIAPDFTLDTLAGTPLRLSDLHGHPVLLNLWASWCPPCRAEMPALEELYQNRRDDGLIVIGLNVTSQDSEAAARSFARDYGLTFPIALDRNGLVSARYALTGLPSSYFIDATGIIRHVIIGGPMNEAVALSHVEDLLQPP